MYAMPSWNVHIAHVERLLADAEPSTSAICDRDAFALGNLVPDVYVGYMVPDASRTIEYKLTHLADPLFIPAPDASLFYRTYVRGHKKNDVVLGAWCHLLCDHYYNLRTTEYIARIGVQPGDLTRQRKQADFALYGHTLDISLVPRLSDAVLEQCRAFEQYELDPDDMRRAVKAAASIVQDNQAHHIGDTPQYDLLNEEFFASTAHEVDDALREALECYARDKDASHLGRAPS